jgi:dipeptidyl-peptidase-3
VLDAKTAFDSLTQHEKLYVHHMSKASHVGALVVLLQTSPEASQIFRLLHRINVAEDTECLKKAALSAGVTEREFKAFLVYASGTRKQSLFHSNVSNHFDLYLGIYTNMGNYKGLDDSKIVPNIEKSRFQCIVKASAAAKSNDGFSEDLLSLWNNVKDDMYRLTERQKQLGLGKKGVTTYFSDNCDREDAERVNRQVLALQAKLEWPDNTILCEGTSRQRTSRAT